MRLNTLLIAILFSFSLVSAQTLVENKENTDNSDKIKYRAEVGYGQQFRYGNYTVTSLYHTIKGGMNIEIPFDFGLGLETGLHYSNGFGDRFQLYAHSDTASYKYNAHTLGIPIRGNFTLPIVWGIKAFAYAGPTINMGLMHKDKVSFTNKTIDPAPSNPLDYPQTGTYNTYKDELHRFNLQLGVGGGLQWRNYRVKSGYDWGLNSISQNKNYKQRQKGWHVSFEYEF